MRRVRGCEAVVYKLTDGSARRQLVNAYPEHPRAHATRRKLLIILANGGYRHIQEAGVVKPC